MARTKIFSVYLSLRTVLFPLSLQFFYQLGQLGLFKLNLAEFRLEAFLIVSQLLMIQKKLTYLEVLRVN